MLASPRRQARLAGFSYSFSEHAYGMDVGLSGYAEKLPVLAEAVAAHVKGFTVNSAAFDRILDEVRGPSTGCARGRKRPWLTAAPAPLSLPSPTARSFASP